MGSPSLSHLSIKTLALVAMVTLAFFSNSSFASRQWPLKAISADALKMNTALKPVIIAVIDTGIDDINPALKSMLWQNPGETGLDANGKDKRSNGKDDDQNGFVDDVHGWNFAQSSNVLKDIHGHGTHVAGIISSVSSGRFPPLASNTPLRLMILKYYEANASPFATMNNTVQAIDYAVRHGAQIINYSGGGLNPNFQEKAALKRAADAGVLVVAAAGNESSNSDHVGYYPANYDLPNILSVGAVNAQLQIIESSNFGMRNVDLAAPGEDIPSTLPTGTYGLMTGTSQATAFASAVAGMVLSERNGKVAPERLIEHLTRTAALSPTLRGKVKSESVLNAKRSVRIALDGELSNLAFVENYSSSTEMFFSGSDTLVAQTSSPHWTETLLSDLKVR